MFAWVLHGAEDLRREERAVPGPLADQVLVRVERVGVCGSDVRYYQTGKVGPFTPTRPFVLGHEFSGQVIDAGSEATGLAVGDRVAVDPAQPCLRCDVCREGRSNLCESTRYFGSAASDPPVDGAFCEVIAVPACNCHRLGDEVSYAAGALLEPLGIATHAVQRAGELMGKSVVVSGGGPIGQLVATVSKAAGATFVAVGDPLAYPRSVAAGRVDHAFDPTVDAEAAEIAELTHGGPAVVFEAAGAAASLDWALANVRRGGRVVQIGHLPIPTSVSLHVVMTRELEITGSFRLGSNAFSVGAALVASGRIEIESLVSSVASLDDVPSAIEAAADNDAEIKLQVSASRA